MASTVFGAFLKSVAALDTARCDVSSRMRDAFALSCVRPFAYSFGEDWARHGAAGDRAGFRNRALWNGSRHACPAAVGALRRRRQSRGAHLKAPPLPTQSVQITCLASPLYSRRKFT